MAQLIFYNVPGHGHINPSLPVTAELVRRGHRITYYATPAFRRAIEATGARFEPYSSVGDDFFDPWVSDGLRPMLVAHGLMRSATDLLPELLEHARALQPDAILFDGMCPWGYFVARTLDLPAVASLSLLPPVPPAWMLREWRLLPALVPLIVRDFSTGLEANRLGRALAARYGVPPLAPAALLNAEGDLSLSYTCADFVPYARSVSPSVVFTGWTLADAPAADDPALDPADGRPLLYVSLGTISNGNVGFFRACFEAFAGSDYAVVISTGGRVGSQELGAPPPNITVRPWVAQSALLRRTSLFVTHGGMGSVHDGLFLGLPLLLVPQQEEQAMTARRAAALGAGLVLRKTEVSAEKLRATAARLLAEPHFAAASHALGEKLRAAGGAPRAADHVEALLATRAASKGKG